jgi:cytidylate kinase
MPSSTEPNIAFAGLSCAGKTTHARLLADELGYDYVSATAILLEIVNVPYTGGDVWFSRGNEIAAVRDDGTVDAELERRLLELSISRTRTVFDTWALAWIGAGPMVRIWIESDVPSRTRKCQLTQNLARSPEECAAVLEEKDTFNRDMFSVRHQFDLFRDRQRYNAVLTNSHLIPEPAESAANAGIETFAPVVTAVARCIMNGDQTTARRLIAQHPREIEAITTELV